MTSEQLLTIIADFLTLQRALLTAFFNAYTNVRDMRLLLDFPKSGAVFVDESDERNEWSFSRHGVGLEFRRLKDGVVVDVERAVDEPRLVTAWRLLEYLGSLPSYNEVATERDLTALLEGLVGRGVMRKSDDGYRLSSQ